MSNARVNIDDNDELKPLEAVLAGVKLAPDTGGWATGRGAPNVAFACASSQRGDKFHHPLQRHRHSFAQAVVL